MGVIYKAHYLRQRCCAKIPARRILFFRRGTITLSPLGKSGL